MKYNPESSAKEVYESLSTVRDNFLSRAERCSALTIPMLIPRNSASRRVGDIAEFPTPRQGVGARGVNHLSSRILLTLLPPQAPFFKYSIGPNELDQLSELAPEIQVEIKASLSQREQSVQQAVETENMRVPASEICKHLIVSGNALMRTPKSGGIQFFPLSQYVVMRDAEGDQITDLVVRECLDEAALPMKVLAQYQAAVKKDKDAEDCDTDICIYTRMRLMKKNRYEIWQEFEDGTKIEKTSGSYNSDNVEFHALRWTKVPGESYGRGLVEEYLGDLVALEGLSQALIEGALAAARLVGLVRPNGNTRPKDLNDAANGSFVPGVEGDVKFLQIEKSQDFSTAAEISSRIEKRLEGAFLLNSSVIRDAERVTAEEVRFAAQELETTLGGVYSVLASEFQLPLVRSITARLESSGSIRRFPPQLKKVIKPVIVTGVDALGRNAELERFRAGFKILAETVGPELAASVMKAGPLATFIFSQVGSTIKGIIKTPEELAQEQQQAQIAQMTQEAVSKGIGPGINALAQQQQQPQG